MLKVVIKGTYYKDNHWYSSWNARQKKNCVFFYDYDDYIGYIINNMEYSDLQKLRLNLYNKYHKLIKFTPFGEVNQDGEKFEGLNLESPIIHLDNSEFAEVLPNLSLKRKYFVWDNIREKYFLKSNFINYIKFNVV